MLPCEKGYSARPPNDLVADGDVVKYWKEKSLRAPEGASDCCCASVFMFVSLLNFQVSCLVCSCCAQKNVQRSPWRKAEGESHRVVARNLFFWVPTDVDFNSMARNKNHRVISFPQCLEYRKIFRRSTRRLWRTRKACDLHVSFLLKDFGVKF